MSERCEVPVFPSADRWEFDATRRQAVRSGCDLGFATLLVHAGFSPLRDVARFRSFLPPIVQSVTFPYERFEVSPDFIYGRSKNPTVSVLEERLASLEGGEAAITAGSGSQALFALLTTILRPGDNVLSCLHTFGEGYVQAASLFPTRFGVEFRLVEDPARLDSWESQIDRRTRLLWLETPSNPCLFVADIRALSQLAHSHGVPLLVDNTTATPALQRPLELGADIVLLSLTKFICGNASILGGAVVGDKALIEDIRMNTTEYIGSILSPFEAWLTLQFLETLELRMERHSSNATRVAEFLAGHPNVSRVNYPGLHTHPAHEIAAKQMRAFGGLLSFTLRGGLRAAAKVLNSFRLITHAVTFGTSRTICMHPASITHNEMTPEERAKVGIDDGLLRLSVGLEDPADIIADLEQALCGDDL